MALLTNLEEAFNNAMFSTCSNYGYSHNSLGYDREGKAIQYIISAQGPHYLSSI